LPKLLSPPNLKSRFSIIVLILKGEQSLTLLPGSNHEADFYSLTSWKSVVL
jgi:hypothetical protein